MRGRPNKYNQQLLDKAKKMHEDGFKGVYIITALNIPQSSLSLFKSANFDLDTYLQNNLENARFYTSKK